MWTAQLPFLLAAVLGLFLGSALPSFAQSTADADECFIQSPECNAARLAPTRRRGATTWIRNWNRIAIDADATDHSTRAPEIPEQRGPTRSSRALAIVHIALADVTSAILGGFSSYTKLPPSPRASLRAALAQAAHDTLVELYSRQEVTFRAELEDELEQVPDGEAKRAGIRLGQRAAALILAAREGDGSEIEDPPAAPFESDEPGRWRRDPILPVNLALGAFWGDVRPFVLRDGDQFRIPPPPDLNSRTYERAHREVVRLGGDDEDATPTDRTRDQTVAGIYWGYDGTPRLGTPPRLYNQIAVQIARDQRTGAVGLARLLALVNVGMADGGIAVWDSKFFYRFWRPVTGIREGDGNPRTIRIPGFTPLGAPASNTFNFQDFALFGAATLRRGPGVVPNFTPPFPAYPSGHAGFGGVLFQILRRFYGTDRIAFSFVSDEFNGVTQDNFGRTRPRLTRRFASLSQAEEENGQSRIYLGIHWAFDKTEGIRQGRRVGDFVFENSFRPRR